MEMMEQNTLNEDRTPMPTLKQLRTTAKAALKGHWTNAVLCTLVYLLIGGVISVLTDTDHAIGERLWPLGLAASLLVAVPLAYGYRVAFLRHMQGEPDDDLVTRPFQAFTSYSRYLGTSLLQALLVFLWTLLLIVPGIVKGYAYAMTPYVMHEHPELSAKECLDKSQAMMRGHKWRLFLLDLSFIGWMLLSVLTLDILMLWVQPWMECSRIRFYEELKAAPVLD